MRLKSGSDERHDEKLALRNRVADRRRKVDEAKAARDLQLANENRRHLNVTREIWESWHEMRRRLRAGG